MASILMELSIQQKFEMIMEALVKDVSSLRLLAKRRRRHYIDNLVNDKESKPQKSRDMAPLPIFQVE
jgi:hypothetical protein